MICALKCSDIARSVLSCCLLLTVSAASSQEIRIDTRSSSSTSVTITAPSGDRALSNNPQEPRQQQGSKPAPRKAPSAESDQNIRGLTSAPPNGEQRPRTPSNKANAPGELQAPQAMPLMTPLGVTDQNRGLMFPAQDGENPYDREPFNNNPYQPRMQPAPQLSRTPSSASVQPPAKRPPLPCKKTFEVVDEDVKIKVVNNYCAARILNLSTWRESGKTYLQFEVDNTNGGAQAHLRLAEQWSDRRGRVIGDLIDEQRIAIEAKKNKTVVLSGPTPAAIMATITLFK